MSFDRLAAETVLYNRWKGSLIFVYQRVTPDPATGAPVDGPVNAPVVPTGTTAVYDDPISYGLQLSGYPATAAAPADADVARAAGRWVAFTELSEYRLIQNLIGSFTDVTESDFGRSASYNQLADRWAERAKELREQYPQIMHPYRGGASSGPSRHIPPTAGVPLSRPGYGGPWGPRGRCW
jgi:hypothetical protein